MKFMWPNHYLSICQLKILICNKLKKLKSKLLFLKIKDLKPQNFKNLEYQSKLALFNYIIIINIINFDYIYKYD